MKKKKNRFEGILDDVKKIKKEAAEKTTTGKLVGGSRRLLGKTDEP